MARFLIAKSALFALLASTLLFLFGWPVASHAAFSDVTTQAGLTSSVQSRGAAWGDYNNDSCVDLYVSAASGGSLFQNNCDGTFANVTGSAGITGGNQEWGAAWADYDGDSDLDLYVGAGGPNLLYRNNGNGTFSNVSSTAGVADARGTAGVSWADFDRDGDLDLFVVNRFSTGDRADGLYQNNGDGTFTDIAPSAGVAGDIDRRSFMGVWFDYDEDGHLDLYLSVDFGNDVLYHNNGNGTFSDVSISAGISDPQHGMGVTIGDVNNDGCLDVLSTNNTQASDAEHNASALYLNNCNGTFTRASESMGINDRAVIEWGSNFVDFDNDMDLDLSIVAGGMLSGGEPNVIYENSGSCALALFDITNKSGTANLGAAFGSAWADFDNDGDLDWFVANEVGSNVLLRNDSATGNYLKVKLTGAGSNTHGVGAVVKVTAGGITQSRVVQAGTSYASAEESYAFFGLGVKNSADQVTIVWPTGAQSNLSNVSAGILQVSETGAPPPPPPPPPPASGAIVTGTVLNPSGTAEPGVDVRLRDTVAKREIAMTTTDAAGLYTLNAPAGAYLLQARKANTGWGNISIDVSLTDGETLLLDLSFGGTTPPPPPTGTDATVSGTVFNPSNTPEGLVDVRLWDAVAKREVAMTASDAAGQYTLTAPAGTYLLQARKPGSGFGNASIDVILSDGEVVTYDLTLRP